MHDNRELLDFQEGLAGRLQVSHIEQDKGGFRHVFLQQYLQSCIGEPAPDTWSLLVSEHAFADQGRLEQWGLNLLLTLTLTG